jgi:hypothetical protein
VISDRQPILSLVVAALCSHGVGSPWWTEQRQKSASTQRGGYNKRRFRLVIVVLCFAVASGVAPMGAQVNVTQYHNHGSRDGLYIDPAFTQSAAGNLTRDLGFNGTIAGNVYAQPLYIDDGPGGRPTIIAATDLQTSP